MNRLVPFGFFLALCIIFVAVAFAISEPRMRLLLASRDFRNHYTGALLISHRETTQFYDVGTQYRTQRLFIPELSDRRRLMPFNRPPPVALLLSPLAALPFTQAYRVFTLVNLGLLCITIYVTMMGFSKIQTPDKRSLIAPYVPYVFLVFGCYLPVWITLLQGQFSYLLFLIFYAVWYFSRRKEDIKAGLSLSLLVVFPQLLIVPFLFFLVLRKFKIVLWSALGLLVFFILSISTIGIQGVMNYPKLLLFLSNAGETYTMHPRDEPTIRSWLHILFQNDYTNGSMLFLWILVIGVILYIFMKSLHRSHDVNSGTYTKAFAFMLVATILCSAHTNYHDLMLLLLAFFLYLQSTIALVSPSRLRAITAHKHRILLASSGGVFALSIVTYWYPQIIPVVVIGAYLYYRFGGKPNKRNLKSK